MTQHAYSEPAIRRALATYLPPAMVDLIMTSLGGTLRDESAPVPTEAARKRARDRLRRWGIASDQS